MDLKIGKLSSVMEDWCDLYLNKLTESSQRHATGCLVWMGGPVDSKYGQMRVKFPGNKVSRVMYVHRVAVMVSLKLDRLPEGQEASHLCNNSRCIEPTHLILESHQINSERHHCFMQRVCTRNHEPACIL